MRRHSLHVLIFFLLLGPLPAVAGNISGHIGWAYSDYETSGSASADSLSQHYALTYTDGGALNGGRGGSYLYTLGAEYLTFENTINGVDDSMATYKPLFRGQLLIAPGGLPFRLKLYCEDLHITSTVTDSSTAATSGIVTDFINGKHRKSGATLALGIKNGSYLGSFRETLAKWPRLLMDYNEIEVESFRSKNPQNYRARNLAFVSLNKKDNWFHYRFYDYQDYLAPGGANDFQTKTYILGTINPMLEREWINLTNWIKVSASGIYTQEKTRPENPSKENYSTELQAVGIREGITSSVYSSFRRERTGAALNRRYGVPVTVSKRIDRDTGLSLSASLDRTLNEDASGITEDAANYFMGLRVDTWRSRPRSLSLAGRAEVYESLTQNGSAQEVVAGSHGKESEVIVALRRFFGKSGEQDVDYLEQKLNLRSHKRQSRWSFDAEETLLHGSGSITGGFGGRISRETGGGQTYSGRNSKDLKGETLHSISRLSGTLKSGRTMSNQLATTLDYLKTDDRSGVQLGVSQGLGYQPHRTLSYSMANQVVFGEGQTANSGALVGGEIAVAESREVTRSYYHSSAFSYLPARNVQTSLKLELKTDDGGGETFLGTQNCLYTYYRINGVIRPLVTLTEELTHEMVKIGKARQSLTHLEVLANYFVTQHFTVAAASSYSRSDAGGGQNESLSGSLSASWVYPKLSWGISYGQNMYFNGSSENWDRRLRLNIDKTF